MIEYNNISKILLEKAQKLKDETFAFFTRDKEELSYLELSDNLNTYSNYFHSLGVSKGSKVSIFDLRSKQLLCSYFSLLNLGALIHIIDEKVVLQDLKKMLGIIKPDFLFFASKNRQLIDDLAKNETGSFNTTKIELITPEIILSNYQTKTNLSCDFKENDPAICIFTSGTTGDPKAILSSFKNVLFGGQVVSLAHNIVKSDRLFAVTPFSGANGQIYTIWAPLLSGSSVVYYQGIFTSYGAFKEIETYKATWFNGTPTHFSVFVHNLVNKEECDFSSLKFVRSSAAPLPNSVKEKFEEYYNIPLIETMGISEMTGQVFSNPRYQKRKDNSVGNPIKTGIRIVDDLGNDLSPNEIGEIYVKSEGLMLGYLNDEESTNKAIINGWLKTGDLGYIDEDNCVFVKGRKKEIAIVGGKNVSLREVDEILYQHPSVLHAASINVPDDFSGEKIVACVVPTNDSSNLEQEIMSLCFKHLSNYKCPSKIIVFKDLPKGASGKILRSKVKLNYLEGLKHEN